MKCPSRSGLSGVLVLLVGLSFQGCQPPELVNSDKDGAASENAGKNRLVAPENPDFADTIDFLLDFSRSVDTARAQDELAIKLALWLDPESKQAFDADFLLRNESKVVEDPNGLRTEDLVAEAKTIISRLEEVDSRRSEDAQAFLVDLMLALVPDDTEFAYTAHQLEVKGVRVKWGRFVDGAASAGSTLAGKQALIKGLLVEELADGQVAGQASQMNATVVREGGGKDIEVTFNQSVGHSMMLALDEVMKFITLRHGSRPRGASVEIAFEEQYSNKDGPSAAVACALLLESLITGDEISRQIAVTGDMNADGMIKAVGGIDGKIRGATRRECEVVGLPERNASVVLDLMMIEGVKPLVDIQIFSMANFEEAFELSRTPEKQPQKLREAIEEFAKIQEVLGKPGGENWLKNKFVIERLQKVIELAPNHLSAQNLLLQAQNRVPERLSLEGSLTQITHAAEPLIRAVRQRRFDPDKSSLNEDLYADALYALKRVRPKLDQRTWRCADSIADFATLMREFVNNRPNSYNNLRQAVAEIQSAGENVSREYDNLANQVDVREELIE